MSGTAVICDTGAYSRFIVGAEPHLSTIDRIGADDTFITPVILIELLNWLSGYHQLLKPERAQALKLIYSMPLVHLNEEISKLAVVLAKKNINSKPGDTLVAATALHYSLPIYTLNKKDFRQLGVQLYE